MPERIIALCAIVFALSMRPAVAEDLAPPPDCCIEDTAEFVRVTCPTAWLELTALNGDLSVKDREGLTARFAERLPAGAYPIGDLSHGRLVSVIRAGGLPPGHAEEETLITAVQFSQLVQCHVAMSENTPLLQLQQTCLTMTTSLTSHRATFQKAQLEKWRRRLDEERKKDDFVERHGGRTPRKIVTIEGGRRTETFLQHGEVSSILVYERGNLVREDDGKTNRFYRTKGASRIEERDTNRDGVIDERTTRWGDADKCRVREERRRSGSGKAGWVTTSEGTEDCTEA